jgi:hypothetical protein
MVLRKGKGQKGWKGLAEPVYEMAAHFILSVIAILAIAVTDLLLSRLGLGVRTVPFVSITLSDWMFDLDVVSATLVNVVGMIRAVIVLWTSQA